MKMLSFNGVKIGRPRMDPLIHIDSFELQAGLHLLAAPNGYGKSTFLQTVSGSLSPLSGELLLNQKTLVPEKRVFYMSEYLSVLKYIYPKEWIDFILADRPRSDASLKHWTQEFRLDTKRYMGELSQGERRKVFWLAAILSDCPILLLDEPLDGLDLFGMKVAIEMLRTWKEQGRIVVLVAHQIADLLEIVDDVLLIKEQKLMRGSDVFPSRAAKNDVYDFYASSGG